MPASQRRESCGDYEFLNVEPGDGLKCGDSDYCSDNDRAIDADRAT
jgi:hypothetical protein